MRWPWRRHDPEAQAAKDRAEQALEAARRRRPEVERVSRQVQARTDQFAVEMDRALRGRRA